MKPFAKIIISSLTLSMFLGGCAPREYTMDPSMGIAVHESLTAQIINPNGTLPIGPQGLGGAPSKAVMDRYVSTFMAPPPPTSVFAIGIGSGSGAMTTPAATGSTP